jgi:hypothetical protein
MFSDLDLFGRTYNSCQNRCFHRLTAACCRAFRWLRANAACGGFGIRCIGCPPAASATLYRNCRRLQTITVDLVTMCSTLRPANPAILDCYRDRQRFAGTYLRCYLFLFKRRLPKAHSVRT